jgi:hypothetical protein
MRKLDLWPTTVYQSYFSHADCDFLRAVILSNSTLDKHPEEMITDGTFNFVRDRLSSVGEVTIIDAWIRTVELDCNNEFEVHCDSHKGTDYIGVLWITGDEDAGGDLVLYDPAWRNPQHIRHEQQKYSLNKTFKFSVGTLTVFPSCVWHKITAYHGLTERISLNFAINIDGPNN